MSVIPTFILTPKHDSFILFEAAAIVSAVEAAVCVGAREYSELICLNLIYSEHAQLVQAWSGHAQFLEIQAVAGASAGQQLFYSGLILFKKAMLMLSLDTSDLNRKHHCIPVQPQILNWKHTAFNFNNFINCKQHLW